MHRRDGVKAWPLWPRACFRVQSKSGCDAFCSDAESFEKTTTMPNSAYATVKSCEYQRDGEKSP